MQRRPIIPNHILVLPSIVQHDVVVLGRALVRTVRRRRARAEEGRVDDGGEREVVPDAEARLVEVLRVGGLCDGLAGDADLDGAGGGENVDALEGVFWVAVDGEVFFQPGV